MLRKLPFFIILLSVAGLPAGLLASEYNGIPIIPGASKGKEIINSAYYEYRAKKSLTEVEAYYTRFYQNKGWQKSISARSKKHVLTGGPSLDIRFSGENSRAVNMVLMYSPKERATLVWLKNRNFNEKNLRNPKVRDENAEKLLQSILD